jgi:hypothetical protein
MVYCEKEGRFRPPRGARSAALSNVPTSARAKQTLRAASASVMLANGMGNLRFFSSQERGPGGGGDRRGRFVAALALVMLLAACGHPASEAECRIILERIVELELKSQKVNDPAEIAKRRSESLGLSSDGGRSDLLDGCVGRHITDRALACVKSAETASDITEHCLQ